MPQGNAVYETASHRAVLRADGLLLVYSKTPRVLVERTLDLATGQVMERFAHPSDGTAAGSLMAAMAATPIFAATCDRTDPDTWHIDADHGFQRWAGDQPDQEVRWALTQCGFEPVDIDAMADLCRRHKWDFCPRQG